MIIKLINIASLFSAVLLRVRFIVVWQMCGAGRLCSMVNWTGC